MSRLTADTCKRPAFFVFGIYQPPYPCFLLSETRKAGRFFGATLYPVALRLQDNADFFGATLYPVQAFLLCIPDHFFGAFIQTPTLVSTIFLGYFILSEPITWIQISGMSLVMAAMWLLVRNDDARNKSPNSSKRNDFDKTESLN